MLFNANDNYKGISMLASIIDEFSAKGRVSFTLNEVMTLEKSSPASTKAAIGRLQKKGRIAMPYRGFYVIVPPEYRVIGCLPAEQFIDDLMKHLEEPYYVGLLSAAEYHGAAHHRPQVFQVMASKARRKIRCGKVLVEFIYRKNVAEVPTGKRNTPAGTIALSTPEATAIDLVGYEKRSGGLDNVATVLSELAEKIDARRLLAIAKFSPIAWLQRLGYLLDILGEEERTRILAKYVHEKNPARIPLVPALKTKGAKSDRRWKLLVNATVEADI
jgi:predicted transcriptional regulator of viral defense system